MEKLHVPLMPRALNLTWTVTTYRRIGSPPIPACAVYDMIYVITPVTAYSYPQTDVRFDCRNWLVWTQVEAMLGYESLIARVVL